MKNKLIIALLIVNFILIGIVHIDSNNYRTQFDKKYREISANQAKVIQVYVDTNKTSQNVNKSLGDFHEEIWQMQNDIRIQNEFLRMQYEKYQDYYLKH